MRRASVRLPLAVALLLSTSCRDARDTRLEGRVAEPEILPPAAVRRPSSFESTAEAGQPRVDEAAQMRPTVLALFAQAKVAFPPSQLLLRGFKKEKQLEMWAAAEEKGPLSLVATYEICAASGDLGPKRREGDWQVPEGYYEVDFYHPRSRFYLALRVSYPNESDRILGDRDHPGSAIMIHGRCSSIGCLAMSDERIAEIWVAATAMRDRGRKVAIHLFPTRDMAGLVRTAERGEHLAFWKNLAEGFDAFERDHVARAVTVSADGRYHLR
jgi:murein L,D-transpeptidase YafK